MTMSIVNDVISIAAEAGNAIDPDCLAALRSIY